MKKTSNRKPSVVTLTRFSIQFNMGGRGSKSQIESNRWVFYGVDSQGTERVYADLNSKKEYEAWRETDPLWRKAQRVLIGRLLDNPATRDLVIQLNMKAALDKGDKDTVEALFRHLSPERKLKLLSSDAKNGNQAVSER